jgi:hypothetical protein
MTAISRRFPIRSIVLLLLCSLASPFVRSQELSAFPDFRQQLRHDYILGFLLKRIPVDTTVKPEYRVYPYFVMKDTSSDDIAAFVYYYRHELIEVSSFSGTSKLVLLAEKPDALSELFLFDDDLHGNRLLDSLEFDTRNDATIRKFSLNRHPCLIIDQTFHGTGYKEEQMEIIGIINGRFQSIFTTSVLEARNWDFTTDDFDRKVRKVNYIDVNKDGYVDISIEGREDTVHVGKHVDFLNAPVKKRGSRWTEVYTWNEQTYTFDLDKQRSKIDGLEIK